MSKILAVLVAAVLAVSAGASPALADHTDPREPISSTNGADPGEGAINGEGTWEFIANFPPNPGTDLEFFKRGKMIFAASGTLGQANAEHVGQRIIRLTNRKGKVKPKWLADHGSAHCPTANPSGTTGLQHDSQVTGYKKPRVLIDTTDATGRCHDPGGGGLEFIDISRVHKKKFKPRELHLTRHMGWSHTVTVDSKRPWIVYNSSSDFSGAPWIDVLNIRSCMQKPRMGLKKKRNKCRPKVYRIFFQPDWSRQEMPDGTLKEGSEAACHDITSRGNRIYCAALNATIVFDVKNLWNKKKKTIRGKPLPCEVIDGTTTAAKVTNCRDLPDGQVPQAKGWKYLGHVNHPGRNDGTGGTQGNTNLVVPSREGVAVAHEADPTHDGKWMFVTDERGGGVVPGGASCSPGVENTYGNGGVHVFDLRSLPNIEYAQTPDGEKAVFVGEPTVPASTFCTSHVMELIPKEQRFTIAWYSQGAKIVDYFINSQGRWTFNEIASVVWPGAQTWTAEVFKIKNNGDGTKTYYFMASDIARGIDIYSWTGPPNPIGSMPPATPDETRTTTSSFGALGGLGLLILAPMARRRRRTR